MELIMLMGIGFLASVVGAICGIGGGVIIKPVLDSTEFAGADTISFLSGLTVLCMSGYSMVKSFISKETPDLQTGTPLAIGAAIGGIVGRSINKKIDSSKVDILFACFLFVIIAISIYNVVRSF